MKSIFRHKFEFLRRQFTNDPVTKSVTIQVLAEILENLSPDSINKDRSISAGDFSPDEAADDVEWEE
jgi:hypothetical protein